MTKKVFMTLSPGLSSALSGSSWSLSSARNCCKST